MNRLLAAIIVMLCTVGAARAEQTPVGTALILLVDVSGSIDNTEYDLQKNGIAAAFRDPAVVRAIWNQPYGRMAVAVVEWSDTANLVIPWTVLEDEVSAAQFAAMLDDVVRTSRGSTALGAAVAFAVDLFESCSCEAGRRVIDVSGDGLNNSGALSASAGRDLAVSRGIIINGLPITGEGSDAGLYEHYDAEVKGGTGAFIIEARGFEDFARAIRQKLVLEIAYALP
ncbi:MAG TPA: DUF1194 domain-containing protein [Alphaproteobacteria bacterium]|nr:DUF1194 domain-containing protein [Alphaproteobacteria bacterium]